MLSPEIIRQKELLDDLFAQIKFFQGNAQVKTSGKDNLELQAHWAKYLCVLISGFIETSVREIFIKYSSEKPSPDISQYVRTTLRDFQNPNMERIVQLTRSFNSEWADELKARTEGELKDAIDSVVDNRHHIAHGRSVGLSYSRIREYYQNVVKVVELLDAQCSQRLSTGTSARATKKLR